MASKYKAQKQVVDGTQFDSKAEANYYLYLKALQQKGEIQSIKLQPVYILQEGFTKNGKKYQPIKYIADFEITKADGTVEVIDVKGFETKDFKLKRKMFERVYKDLELKLVK